MDARFTFHTQRAVQSAIADLLVSSDLVSYGLESLVRLLTDTVSRWTAWLNGLFGYDPPCLESRKRWRPSGMKLFTSMPFVDICLEGDKARWSRRTSHVLTTAVPTVSHFEGHDAWWNSNAGIKVSYRNVPLQVQVLSTVSCHHNLAGHNQRFITAMLSFCQLFVSWRLQPPVAGHCWMSVCLSMCPRVIIIMSHVGYVWSRCVPCWHKMYRPYPALGPTWFT